MVAAARDVKTAPGWHTGAAWIRGRTPPPDAARVPPTRRRRHQRGRGPPTVWGQPTEGAAAGAGRPLCPAVYRRSGRPWHAAKGRRPGEPGGGTRRSGGRSPGGPVLPPDHCAPAPRRRRRRRRRRAAGRRREDPPRGPPQRVGGPHCTPQRAGAGGVGDTWPARMPGVNGPPPVSLPKKKSSRQEPAFLIPGWGGEGWGGGVGAPPWGGKLRGRSGECVTHAPGPPSS